jgi:MoxR-like ATPase
MEHVTIDDVELILTRPVEQDLQWIGQEELVDQILASWLVVADRDLPLCPRLVGRPGVGKTTLAYAAARAAGLPAYIHQCTVDTRPEDLLVTPVLSREGKISYHASSLVSAVVKGGVAILDEANRMSEKSWASLAPLLDHRRYVESVVAGVRIPAHPDFRACITMNDDASTYEIPDYMLSRIQPAVEICFPEKEEEFRILRYHLPFAPEEVLALTVDFLQEAHRHGLGHSTRDGINIVRYAIKMGRRGEDKGDAPTELKELFERAVKRILGKDAFDFEKHSLKKEAPQYLDLREFFAAMEGMNPAAAEEESPGEEEPEAGPEDLEGGPGPGKGRSGGGGPEGEEPRKGRGPHKGGKPRR